ncbi:MAG: hypothetical protein ABJH06_14430 [Paraglaciecola sp.]|uniref:hypothetical protein n=1 Tax=Paraglaciecola sp. TaxID=1920173 RepID=UPI00329A21B9
MIFDKEALVQLDVEFRSIFLNAKMAKACSVHAENVIPSPKVNSLRLPKTILESTKVING